MLWLPGIDAFCCNISRQFGQCFGLPSASFGRPIALKTVTKVAALCKGTLNEYIKETINIITNIYVKLFNIVFHKGIFPDAWLVRIIRPICKNNDINKPEKYRLYLDGLESYLLLF